MNRQRDKWIATLNCQKIFLVENDFVSYACSNYIIV